MIFTGENSHWIARYLHRVNHCFICVAQNGYWIVSDYTFSGLRLSISQELPKGLYYHPVQIDSLNLMPFLPTCVGMVKHSIGIKNPLIQTPWQLLKHLRSHYGKQSKETKENI